MKVEELKTRLDDVNKRIITNIKDLGQTRKRLEDCSLKIPQAEAEIECLRKERQKVLADRGDPQTINTAIKKCREVFELTEDEVAGLTEKLAALEKKYEELNMEKPLIERHILIEETLRPLVNNYNNLAREMADTLISIEKAKLLAGILSREARDPDADIGMVLATRAKGPFDVWDNSSLAAIPSLMIRGEYGNDQGWFWVRRHFMNGPWAKEIIEAHSNARDDFEKKQPVVSAGLDKGKTKGPMSIK